MGLRALGDSAWLFEAGGEDPRRRLELILKLRNLLERQRIPEVLDIVSSFASVAACFDPSDGERVLAWLTSLQAPGDDDTAGTSADLVEIPVVYGEDLGSVAEALGRSEIEIVRLHSEAEYTVAAVGFSPGFPYLLGLDPRLHLPRKTSPQKVRAGSVAIAGNQAGIYPFDSQGGWHVLGRTNTVLFDPSRPEAALLRPGDKLRFKPVKALSNKRQPSSEAPSHEGGIEIIEPGACTTVQDLGRPGFQASGVSPGGTADPVAARVANRLVGNPDDAALLECAMTGPVLRFTSPARVAWIGWADARSGRPIAVDAGDEIDLRSRMRSLRGYIAISGGIDVPFVMGSRATDVRAKFGGHQGRALRQGDCLAIGKPAATGPPAGDWCVTWPLVQQPQQPLVARFLAGMQAQWFSKKSREIFTSSIYQTSAAADRTGVRLDGPLLDLAEPREMVSQPVVRGSVQVPPDGRPILLLAECQTIGGYPQIGHVISADLPALARALPGTAVSFREVSLDEARMAWRDSLRELRLLQTGLRFLT